MIGIVPTRDEAETIGQTVDNLLRLVKHVVVVDSSSDTATSFAAVAAGAKVIECAEDGLGPAYLLAWDQARLRDEPVLHADAGGSHPFSSAAAVRDAYYTLSNRADVVIGSRFMSLSSYEGNPRRRRMSQRAANMCNLVSHHEFSDWTSGLRAYSPDAIDVLRAHEFTTTGHAWQIEALDVCATAGLTIIEVPITYIAGRSHLNGARIREAGGYWWRMLRS